jgi:hypothetical protein
VRPISLWHRARVVHLFHPPHRERLLWADADRYYKRAGLPVEAPAGLRELARELAEQGSPERERLTGT